jgi:hypothetical protein
MLDNLISSGPKLAKPSIKSRHCILLHDNWQEDNNREEPQTQPSNPQRSRSDVDIIRWRRRRRWQGFHNQPSWIFNYDIVRYGRQRF